MKKTQKHKKKTPYNAHTATKMVWVMVLVGFFSLFLVGTVSAELWITEFDNVKNYDEETQTIEIRNSVLGIPFLQLGKVTEIKLNTPSYMELPRGYQKVAEFEVTSFRDYSGAFKELELFDKNNNDEKFLRDYDFKVLSYENVPVYETICESIFTPRDKCLTSQVGTERREVWTELTSFDFKKDDIMTIGIFTEVKKGDYVEWIPNFFGVRINEWATWREEDAITEAHGVTLASQSTSGLALRGMNITIGDEDIVLINLTKHSVSQTNGTAVLIDSTDNSVVGSATFSGDTATFSTAPTTNVTMVAGAKYAILVWSDGAVRFAAAGYPIVGTHLTWTKGIFNGLDSQNNEANEIISIGVSCIQVGPEVTLIAPADNSNFSASNVTFNVTVTDDTEVSEVKLFIDGVVNETNTSLVNGTYIFERIMADGNHNWSIGAEDNTGETTNSSVREFLIDTTAPAITNQNITEADSKGIVGVHLINTNLTFTWNVTDITSNLDTCTFNHDGNVTVNCTVNTTSFNITDLLNKNLTFFANDTFGNEASVFVTWDYNVSQFNSTFSATTFETKTETFMANITLGADLNGTTISNVRLFYNGSENTGATATNTAGQNYNLSHTIDIPIIGTGISNWFFSFDADGVNVNTTTQTQTVTELLFQLCNATHSTQFINFTFRNETTNEEVVSASISSTWIFYLGQGLINKTLTFSNTTENLNYSFCSSAVTDILTTTSSIAYTNAISQQRIFEPTLLTLTNITDARTLYLLPTFKGLFSQFRTEDTLGNSIAGAIGVITRILNGVLISITSDATDGSGLVLFFLDPDITYTATFSAVGFDDNTFTFVPTTDLRTVIMGGEVVAVEGSEISLGMSYNITPTNTTLNNGTDVLFQFNVTSTETVTFMGFDISNGTVILLSKSQASDGSLSGTLNTGNHSRLIGVYTISTANETITVTRIWKVDQSFIGDYSIFRQFNLYMDYGFEDFGRLLIVLLVIAGAMILMSKEIGIDEEVKMVVGILIVWAFSIVGWLDTGIVVETASSGINDLTQFSNQYGIAMVSTIAAAYFILRRVFRQI